jgi:release factor glutamine methyltransferase
MTIQALKSYFKTELLGYYPDSEIDSFFYLLGETILKMKKVDLTLNEENDISSETYIRFQDVIEHLKVYKPVQYILGETEFFGLKFKVSGSVLIPRPETEELVDWIIKDYIDKQPMSILDIGTGSGCIAISLVKNLKNSEIYAMDISSKSLKLARNNARINNVPIQFIEMDILDSTQWDKVFQDKKFDVIVSNPPYVRQSEKLLMRENVLNYEPHLAMFVEDEDALLFYRLIVEFSEVYLKKEGSLYFEINEGLGEETANLLKSLFKNVELREDINGKQRMIKGIKNE